MHKQHSKKTKPVSYLDMTAQAIEKALSKIERGRKPLVAFHRVDRISSTHQRLNAFNGSRPFLTNSETITNPARQVPIANQDLPIRG